MKVAFRQSPTPRLGFGSVSVPVWRQLRRDMLHGHRGFSVRGVIRPFYQFQSIRSLSNQPSWLVKRILYLVLVSKIAFINYSRSFGSFVCGCTSAQALIRSRFRGWITGEIARLTTCPFSWQKVASEWAHCDLSCVMLCNDLYLRWLKHSTVLLEDFDLVATGLATNYL